MVSIGKDFLVWGVVRGEVRGKRRVSVQRRRYGHEESQAWAWEGRKKWTCVRMAVSILCRDGRPAAATVTLMTAYSASSKSRLRCSLSTLTFSSKVIRGLPRELLKQVH